MSKKSDLYNQNPDDFKPDETKYPFISYEAHKPDMPNGAQSASQKFYDVMNKRRTIRHYSSKPVSRQIIENCIKAAGTAPSGANQQPWHFCAISNPKTKEVIRNAAEVEEKAFYEGKATPQWLEALAPLGVDANKQFIETAPWVIAIFAKKQGQDKDGNKVKHYYFNESVGLATGMLITALHNVGLSTLTHTPSPMGFLNTLCDRPKTEKPYMLLIVGYPADNNQVPDIHRKPLNQISNFIE